MSYRSKSLPSSFEGCPREASSTILHMLFEIAQEVTIATAQATIESLAALTCGMQPLVGKSTKVRLLLHGFASEGQIEASSQLKERIGVFSHLFKNRFLECHVVPSQVTFVDSRFSLSAGPIVTVTDAQGDSVSIVWERPLSLITKESVRFHLFWSWGDPAQEVHYRRKSLFRFFLSNTAVCSATETADFVSILESVEPVVVPYIESFVDNAETQDYGLSLYTHQKKAISDWILNGRRGIFKMCTGSGKTIASLFALRNADPADGPILVTVPTRVLADQWIEQIKRLGFYKILTAYESAAGWIGLLDPWLRSRDKESPRFVVTTYKTFADERFLAKIDRLAASGSSGVWIADEMHNLASTRLMEATQRVGLAFTQRIGLSATPEIEGNESLTDRLLEFFGGIIATYSLKDGIDEGVLCRYRYHPFPAYLDPARGIEYLKTLQGIENQGTPPAKLVELYRQSRELIRKSGVQLPALDAILDRLVKAGDDLRHTLIYCPPGFSGQTAEQTDEIDVDESQTRLLEDVVAAIRRRGLTVSSILGETPKTQRSAILDRFSEGSLDVLCAIGCLDEGIDVPSIKRAIVLYSIDREKQFVQRRGRILRTIRGTVKTADIYDVVILPHGTDINPSDAERLLNKELRRYRSFSDLALNASQAHDTIKTALETAMEVKI